MVRRIRSFIGINNELGGANIILIFLFFMIFGISTMYNVFNIGVVKFVRNKAQNVVDLATSRVSHEVLIEGESEEETIKILQELGEGLVIGEGTKTNPYVKIDREEAMKVLERQVYSNLGSNTRILFSSPVLFDMNTGEMTIYLEGPLTPIRDENAIVFNKNNFSDAMAAKSKIENFASSMDPDSGINYSLNLDFSEIDKSTYLTVVKVESAILKDPLIVASFGGSQVYRKY
ncbi:hypothetical protein NE686_17315 [Tissierella carlieri]|uniref:Uncharacterized protein n=1 Tax=Tissierella carlieri TaxID=689904 RepID=A0ABT1SEH3_9FIRM|nr:hypothetical protein [Tissierella carlieri]MCQ4924865.1 hypothetical protein [Tissierella carlieri]